MARERPRALVGNAADEEQVDNATRVVSERAEIEKADVRASLATPELRREFYRHLMFCGSSGVRQSSFAGESPLTMAFHEGQRNVGLWLEARAKDWAPELYTTMITEAIKRGNT